MKITAHWLKVAYERVRAGEDEKEVLNDYGWVNVKDKISELLIDELERESEQSLETKIRDKHIESLEADVKRLRELLKETLFYVGHAEYNLDLLIRIEKELEK